METSIMSQIPLMLSPSAPKVCPWESSNHPAGAQDRRLAPFRTPFSRRPTFIYSKLSTFIPILYFFFHFQSLIYYFVLMRMYGDHFVLPNLLFPSTTASSTPFHGQARTLQEAE